MTDGHLSHESSAVFPGHHQGSRPSIGLPPVTRPGSKAGDSWRTDPVAVAATPNRESSAVTAAFKPSSREAS